MHFVYLIRSVHFPDRTYIGLTADLDQRIRRHNSGTEGGFAAKYRPWELVVAIRFEDRARANEFERYLKSGSGRSFAKRHFW